MQGTRVVIEDFYCLRPAARREAHGAAYRAPVDSALSTGLSFHDRDWHVDVVAPLRAVASEVKAVALVESDRVEGGLDPHGKRVGACIAKRVRQERGSDTATRESWRDEDGQHFAWFPFTKADNFCVSLGNKYGSGSNAREIAFRYTTTQPPFDDLRRIVRGAVDADR